MKLNNEHFESHPSFTPPLDRPLPLGASGQEEIDDIIKRDMHRTFPEHPMFSSEAGQGALFRVLKAYSLHDLEVNCHERRARESQWRQSSGSIPNTDIFTL